MFWMVSSEGSDPTKPYNLSKNKLQPGTKGNSLGFTRSRAGIDGREIKKGEKGKGRGKGRDMKGLSSAAQN